MKTCRDIDCFFFSVSLILYIKKISAAKKACYSIVEFGSGITGRRRNLRECTQKMN